MKGVAENFIARIYPERGWRVFLALLLAVWPSFAAAEVKIELSADRQEMSVNDRVQITVAVSGTMRSLPTPQLQNIQDFTVLGQTGESSSFSLVNGQFSVSKSIGYILVPNAPGSHTIGPAVVEIGGKKYESNPLTIEVAAAGSGPGQPKSGGQAAPSAPQAPAPAEQAPPAGSDSGDRNTFIRGTVDKNEVYLGEQVTYTFSFYNRLRLSDNPQYSPPTFSGLWVEELDKQARQFSRAVGGMVYSCQELRYALFPTIEGETTVSGASLAYAISNPWDFFDRGKRVKLETQPVKIIIKPLPLEGRPENFSGAVGDFTVAAGIDKDTVKQGEAITLDLVISGDGNIRTIQEPKLSGKDDFDVYESKSEENLDRSSGVIKGKKTFKYVIVPRKAGEYRWPGMVFSYFDPSAGKYVSLQTREISFSVTPTEEQQGPVTYHLKPESVVSVGEDIRYIKEELGSLRGAEAPLFKSPLFWLLHLVPVFGVGLALVYRRHRGRLLTDTGYARLRGSRKRLARQLKAAAKASSAGNFAQCYAALDRSLIHFIGDKLDVETVGMLTEGIDELLAGRKVEENVRRDVRECLEHFAFVRFAPQTGADARTAGEYLKKVSTLAERLDRVL